jgi:hypothetical protein
MISKAKRHLVGAHMQVRTVNNKTRQVIVIAYINNGRDILVRDLMTKCQYTLNDNEGSWTSSYYTLEKLGA